MKSHVRMDLDGQKENMLHGTTTGLTNKNPWSQHLLAFPVVTAGGQDSPMQDRCFARNLLYCTCALSAST
jgi:hypothetical protein